MSNDFLKGFFTGAGRILGVLSIPLLGIYVLYLLYGLVSPQINKILVKQEFRDWSECFLVSLTRMILMNTTIRKA